VPRNCAIPVGDTLFMPVDFDRRQHFAEILWWFCTGSLTIVEFEADADEMSYHKSEDSGLRDIHSFLLEFWADTYESARYSLADFTGDEMVWIARIQLFLHSGTDYGYPATFAYSPARRLANRLMDIIWGDDSRPLTLPAYPDDISYWPFKDIDTLRIAWCRHAPDLPMELREALVAQYGFPAAEDNG